MVMSSLFIVGLYTVYQFLYQVPEIDWQEFRTKYLGTDSVGKIEVINKNLVYIYPKVSLILPSPEILIFDIFRVLPVK